MKTKSMKKAYIVVLIMACLLVMPVAAKATLIYNPATGHWYGLVNADTGVYDAVPGGTERTWAQAEASAVAIGGHLVTINDADENAWLVATFFNPDLITAAFIGLYQSPSQATPGAGWNNWISGETASYRNWHTGEPNDFPDFVGVGNLNTNGTEDGEEQYSSMRSNGWYDSGIRVKAAGSLVYAYGIAEVVPEPTTMLLLGLGLVGLAGLRRKFRS